MAEERKIGRGLSALLGDDIDFDSVLNNNTEKKDSTKIDINKIRPNPDQPRKYFNQDGIKELSESIKQYGLLQPIIVRKLNENDYIIISGERRWRASKECGLNEISAIIKEKDEYDDYAISVIENIQRENLSFSEEINAYKILIEKYHLTHEDLSSKVSKSRSYITNMIRISKLPEKIIEYINSGVISIGHGKILAGLDNPLEIADLIIKNSFSVRQTEEFLKKEKDDKKIEKNPTKFKEFEANQDEIVDNDLIDCEIDEVDAIIGIESDCRIDDRKIFEPEKEVTNEMKELNEISKMISKKTGFYVKIESNDSDSGFLNISYSNKKELEEIINKLIS